MDPLTQLLANPDAPALATDLFGLSLKAAAILLGALAATTLLRRAPAATRHQIWALALAGVLALPALTVILPAWDLPVLPQWAPAVDRTPAAEPEARPQVAPRAVTRPQDRAKPTSRSRSQAEGVAGASASDHVPVPPAASRHDTTDGSVISGAGIVQEMGGWSGARIALAALGLWIVGATILLARLALSSLAAWRLVRRAEAIRDPAILADAEAVRRELGLGGGIRLVRHRGVDMPMAWGLLRPSVVLPPGSSDWSADRRRVVLLHEMAHLKRRDCHTLLLARLVTALHWFNPLAWVATRRLQSERERACDDLVLGSGTAGTDYAQHLLDIARAVRTGCNPGWATVAMARPSELEGRLLAILDPRRRRARVPRVVTGVAALAVTLTVAPLAAVQPSALAEKQERQSTTESAALQDLETRIEVDLRRRLDMLLRSQGRVATQVHVPPLGGVELSHDLTRVELPQGMSVELDAGAAEAMAGVAQGLAAGAAQGLGASVAQGLSAGLGAGLENETSGAGQEQGDLNPRVMQAFLTALQDENAEIRAQAAHSLGSIESEAAVGPLIEVLRNDADEDVRSAAAWALGMIESDEAVDALLAALADADTRVRSQSIWALGMIESPQAVDGLVAALGGEDSEVRSRAAWALGMIEDAGAVGGLTGALSDADAEVRNQAAWALGMIEDAAAVEALVRVVRNDDSAAVRKQAAWALGMIEDEAALEALLDAMTDEDLGVRKTALWAVSQISG